MEMSRQMSAWSVSDVDAPSTFVRGAAAECSWRGCSTRSCPRGTPGRQHPFCSPETVPRDARAGIRGDCVWGSECGATPTAASSTRNGHSHPQHVTPYWEQGIVVELATHWNLCVFFLMLVASAIFGGRK